MMYRKTSGLTLVEIIVGIALMAMVATTLSALSQHALQASRTVERVNQSTHVVEVIHRTFDELMRSVVSTEDFSGLRVVQGTAGQSGLAVRCSGSTTIPHYQDFAFLAAHPNRPHELCLFRPVEMTGEISGRAEQQEWNIFFETAMADPGTTTTRIVDCLVTEVSSVGPVSQQFWSGEACPSEHQLEQFRNGLLDWDRLSWPQSKAVGDRGLQRQRVSGIIFIRDSAGHALPVQLSFATNRVIVRRREP